MNSFDRELPNNFEAERCVIGSILLDGDLMVQAKEIIRDPAMFWDERNRIIWVMLLKMWDDGIRNFDGTVLHDRLDRMSQFEKIGGYDYLSGSLTVTPDHLRVCEYAEIIQERYLRRQLIQAACYADYDAYELKLDIGDVIDETVRKLESILESRVIDEPEPLGKYFAEHLAELESGMPYGLQTKFGSWNRITGGLQPEMLVIGARPSVGKTALGLNLFVDVAINCNTPSVFFSLEMSRAALTNRIVSILADVPHDHLRRRNLSENDKENIRLKLEQIESENLIIDDSKIGVREICNRAKLLKRKCGVGAVYVDYLQLIRAEQSKGVSREVVVADMSHCLKELSGSLNCPVVVLAQLNRDPAKQGERPELHHLRESDAIGHDADTVILLWDDPRNQLPPERVSENVEIIYDNPIVNVTGLVAKQRNGPRGQINMIFDRTLQQFREGTQAV